MKKFNKQLLLDLEKKSKGLRMTSKDNIKEYTSNIASLRDFAEELIHSINKELEKYSYCEYCDSYHTANDFQKLRVEIKEDEPEYGYYYDVCPTCKHKRFVEKFLLEKD